MSGTRKRIDHQTIDVCIFFWKSGVVIFKTDLYYAIRTQALGAAASPLRAVAYPSVLPVMHPAFRGLCKPGQPLTIGHLGPGKSSLPIIIIRVVMEWAMDEFRGYPVLRINTLMVSVRPSPTFDQHRIAVDQNLTRHPLVKYENEFLRMEGPRATFN